jgi:hypothetical protein
MEGLPSGYSLTVIQLDDEEQDEDLVAGLR